MEELQTLHASGQRIENIDLVERQIELQRIFTTIQKCSSAVYNESIKAVCKILAYEYNCSSNSTNGCRLIHDIIHKILLCPRGSIPVRITNFMSRVFEDLNISHPQILLDIYDYICHFTISKNTKARKFAFLLLRTILKITKYSLDEAKLQIIVERLFDKDTGVRKEALRCALLYQDSRMGKSLQIWGIIKDLVRYDTSSEIRRIAMSGLEPHEGVLNCILERAQDVSPAIRKAFWLQRFEGLDLGCLQSCQRIFLMKIAFAEREFDAKSIFIDRISTFGLENVIEDFVGYENNELNRIGSTSILQMFDEVLVCCLEKTDRVYKLDKLTPGWIHFIEVYFKYREERAGRDSLNIKPINEFISIIYGQIEDIERDGATENKVKIVQGLFRLVDFYDVFTDETRKKFLNISHKILAESKIAEVAEEAVVLCKKLSSSDVVRVLGSVIKKTKGSALCIKVCEAVLKHIPFCAMHEAIFEEIVLLSGGSAAYILFWYILQNQSKTIIKFYLDHLPDKKILDGACDLVIKNIIDISEIISTVVALAQNLDESVVVSCCKLILAGKIEDPLQIRPCLTGLILIYYMTQSEEIQQFLSLFFFEYFRIAPQTLIEIFPSLLESITDRQRIFVDQSFYWLSFTNEKQVYYELYFKICVYILNNFESLKNKKHLFSTLEKIQITEEWDKSDIKKLIYLMTMIIKKRPKENSQLLISRLMEMDDGEPLEPSAFQLLKDQIGHY
ncbi:hypothetical protein ENBRE01_2854 [Enteropsectra breve]|nr:hypothetical protein ENBRE01_2854 [Enteropsectra breve]